jgi:nucleoside-diphosphate-sugar epimerase
VTKGRSAGVPGVVGRHLMLRLQAATHEVRTVVDAEVSVLVRALSTAAEHHHEHEREVECVDESAGSEFVDDRLRLPE